MMQVYTWDWDWYSPSMKLLLPQVVTGQEYWYKASIYPCHACFGFTGTDRAFVCVALHVFVEFLSLKRQQVSNASSTMLHFFSHACLDAQLKNVWWSPDTYCCGLDTFGSMKYYAHFGCVMDTKKQNITCLLCSV